ncbi:MAG: (d)CMP kinase [Spirochaetes bacterium]|nr:(d)CMP kinase [Spirochaetota bacterium]
MVVALDGPAGAGKSSVARRVAEQAGFAWLNSGSFYRAVTWAVLSKGRNPADREAVVLTARAVRLSLDGGGGVAVDGQPVEHLLRSDAIDEWVARHSAIGEVRSAVNRRLRDIAAARDVVVDGRDIATVVFPDADVKVYLDADVATRARRRHAQGTSRMSLEEIERSIVERDRFDRLKAEAPLAVAPGALILDTSHLTIEEVCDRVLDAIHVKKLTLGDKRQV